MYICRILLGLILGAALAVCREDVKGSADHPLFPVRVEGYAISTYAVEPSGSYGFRTSPIRIVQGRYTKIEYFLNDPDRHPGGAAIRVHYQTRLPASAIVQNDADVLVWRTAWNGGEIWAELHAPVHGKGRYYFLRLVESTPQAASLVSAFDSGGSLTLDIRFGPGRSDILPASDPVIAELARMLRARPSVVVALEAHSDDSGTPEGDLRLTQARAESVAIALVDAGIGARRLKPKGKGHEQPVADNRTEEGRTKNRRVEIRRIP